jgi:hypothetical protein
MSTARQEFIVTLKDYNFLENFYHDMETEGTSKSFIPSRSVSCVDRRPSSRNTHYLLTRDEARELANDERVESVELKLKDPLINSKLHASQTATWSRSDAIEIGQRNWGLYRCLSEENAPQWGSESLINGELEGTINLDASGKNVDIIIVDEVIWPDHPELGNRVIEYDWFGEHDAAVRGTGCIITHVTRNGSNVAKIYTQTAHNIKAGAVINVVCTSDNSFNATGVTVTAVGVTTGGEGGDGVTVNTISYANTGSLVARTSATGFWRGVYQYPVLGAENDHATHVAGIAAGNTQGWAREANIYNLIAGLDLPIGPVGAIDPNNPGDEFYTPTNLLFNYIREFHNNKPINPETGRKNPTIVNNSWGIGRDLFLVRNPFTGTSSYDFSKINYRGTEIRPTGTPVDTGISGIFTATNLVSSLNSTAPGTANIIQTTGTSAGTVTSTTYDPNGRTGLTQIANPTFFDPSQFSDNDEAYWTITPPFAVTYMTQSYSEIHVTSNSYITFGAPVLRYILDASSPNVRKIFVSAGDRSCEGVWTGTFGTTGSRTFIVRWEGYEGAYSTTYETTPTVIWEMKFFEATPNTFQLHIVQNANFRAEFDNAQLLQRGLNLTVGTCPIRFSDIDADISDAIDDGIIFVGSAGNSGMKIDTPAGLDYNNSVVVNGLPTYYHRGGSPGSSHSDVICVGSIDSASTETKATSSNTGPGVDVYAPGRNVISSVYDGSGSLSPTIEENLETYQKLSGTSAASPQVTGILALALENYPNMTPTEAKSFITKFAKNTITDTEGGYDDSTSLQGSANRFAYYRKERPDNGLLIPKTVRFIRPDTGAVFPRPQIRRK